MNEAECGHFSIESRLLRLASASRPHLLRCLCHSSDTHSSHAPTSYFRSRSLAFPLILPHIPHVRAPFDHVWSLTD